MKTYAYVTREIGKMTREEVELDDPGLTELRIRITASGICHTDAAARDQFISVPLPTVLGHEGVGIVDAVGAAVTDFEVGDHVIMSFPSCGCCGPCRKGKPFACIDSHTYMFGGVYRDKTMRIHKNGQNISSFFGQGSFSEYAIVDSSSAVKVDKDIPMASLTSLGCGIQTGAGSVLNKMKPEPGSSIAVFGCGAVGLAGIMAAKIAGCSVIIGIDAVPSRLQLAKELGATHVINGMKQNTLNEIKNITDGEGANYALEASGNSNLVVQSIDCLSVEGMSVIVSVTGEKEIHFKPEPSIMTPCRTFAGLVEGGSNPKVFIPQLVKFYKEGKLPMEKLVKYYKPEDIETAFEDSHSGKVIKPVIIFDENVK